MKPIYFTVGAILALALGIVSAQAQTYLQPPATPVQGYPPQPYPAAPYPPAVQPQPVAYCQPYSDKFTMAGEVRIVHGTACMHPDGSWELHPTDSGLRYVNRAGGLYLIPSQPFAVVIGGGHHHHYYH